MRLHRSKKGVCLYEGKELAGSSPITAVPAGPLMVYPLSQHIGAPARPAAAEGDRVLKGQMIAEAGGPVSAPVYSAVSGTVRAIEKRLVVSGATADCMVIDNDNLYETAAGFGGACSTEGLTAEDVIRRVSKAGIVGLGGAGFPTGVKLSPPNPRDIDTLIINGSECEPYLTADYRLMLEKSEEILSGIRIILKLFDRARAVIGVENNKPDVIRLLERKTAETDRISVASLPARYPQGGERQLIYALTGRKLSARMLPADKGCLAVNAATCFAVYEAVCLQMPLIHRVMTVTGQGAKAPCNLDVPLGISFAQVLAAAGGALAEAVKFIAGGPMMGTAMSTLDVPVEKTSSGLLIFTQDDVAALPQSACIRCGRCVGVCPENLVPQILARETEAERFGRFDALGGMECMECGCCTYVCPARIPLTQMFKLGKARVRETGAAS